MAATTSSALPAAKRWMPVSAEDWTLTAFWVLSIAAYFWNLGVNNIWNPNEGFYADSVREMLASGNYLDLYYNYEPRFNKPPMIYWLIALSGKLFGLNEFTIRLPSALAGLGAVYLTYRIGRLLENERLGTVAAIVMMFSFQFVINARYASPAVTLTFFMTLTLFWFLKAYQERNNGYLWLSYLALGLTVLTKGYPYIIVITGIILVYLLFEVRYDWRRFFGEVWRLHPVPGLLLAIAIGMSWPLYSYLKFGDTFYQVFMDETARRALSEDNRLQPFFYLEANTWGFIPYSLTFYLGLGYLIATRFRGFLANRVLTFGFSWFIVMLVIFTASSGKIPTYFIQGHPGMSLFTAYFIVHVADRTRLLRRLFRVTYIIPGVLFTVAGILVVYFFEGHPLLYLLAVAPAIALAAGHRFDLRYLKWPYMPFMAFLTTYLLFSMVVLPYIEQGYRNHDQIGKAILQAVPDSSVPLLLESQHIHNLPYYAERLVIPEQSPEAIREYAEEQPLLALVPAAAAAAYGPSQLVWEGLIYQGSETRTLEFILNVMKDRRGEPSNFARYQVIYQPN